MNILLLGSQHGTELLGDMLYAYIQKHAVDLLPHITFMIGNPKAHAAGVRFIESDMNRSYDGTLATYESSRAEYIKHYIENEKFDVVLDLHSTTSKQDPCLIVKDIYDENRNMIKSLSIDKVIIMKHPVVDTSLIGVFRHSIVIEIYNDDIVDSLLQTLCNDLRRFIGGDFSQPVEKKGYVINNTILQSSVTREEATAFVNFEMSDQGYIPILTGAPKGENSYEKDTDYLGFKADKETIITL